MWRSERTESQHRGQKEHLQWKENQKIWGLPGDLSQRGTEGRQLNSTGQTALHPTPLSAHTLSGMKTHHQDQQRLSLVSDGSQEEWLLICRSLGLFSTHLWSPAANPSPVIRKEEFLQQQGLHLPACLPPSFGTVLDWVSDHLILSGKQQASALITQRAVPSGAPIAIWSHSVHTLD